MISLKHLKDRQGEAYINDAILHLGGCFPGEVLPSIYSWEIIEEALTEKRKSMQEDILYVFTQKLYAREDDIELHHNDILEYELNILLDVKIFRTKVKTGKYELNELLRISEFIRNPPFYYKRLDGENS